LPFFLNIKSKEMKADFISQLRNLGLEPQEPTTDKVYFEWIVPVGSNIGKRVLVGTTIGDAYPGACPSAPHFKPIDTGWIEHPNNVSDSNFGDGWNEYPKDNPETFYRSPWRYWSRKFDEWPGSEQTAKFYLAHLKKIMTSI
jgi:hypothetical protein